MHGQMIMMNVVSVYMAGVEIPWVQSSCLFMQYWNEQHMLTFPDNFFFIKVIHCALQYEAIFTSRHNCQTQWHIPPTPLWLTYPRQKGRNCADEAVICNFVNAAVCIRIDLPEILNNQNRATMCDTRRKIYFDPVISYWGKDAFVE